MSFISVYVLLKNLKIQSNMFPSLMLEPPTLAFDEIKMYQYLDIFILYFVLGVPPAKKRTSRHCF
jgi:hypothetical protein